MPTGERLATSHHSMRKREVIVLTLLVPQSKLDNRQCHNDLVIHTTKGLFKSLYRAHQYRLATQHQELLGNLGSKPRSTPASHYYRYRLHLSHLI